MPYLRFLAIVILTTGSLIGCGSVTTTHSAGEAKLGDREVKFDLEGNGGVTSAADTATVTFAEGKVVVEKARVLVNEKEVAKIAENVKLVNVDYAKKTLTITADGAKVHEAKMGK